MSNRWWHFRFQKGKNLSTNLFGEDILTFSEFRWALVSGGPPTEMTPSGKCRTGSGVNGSGLWIFTRAQKRDPVLINKIRAIASAKGFDLSVLIDVEQGSNCTSSSK